nr:uncharacterized protein LOC110362496 isoform X9 [Columba livia]XP_021149997.1 uncharacterized protein LOC110362496 isoform X9 [Columba livia]XP_021149998.1 uncharacterized protein LOC110362496 isoform X9 [Columba livia]XP_021149999.1 uncharacterized protein LOC110362496 isoform X9 [Columba livia]XP_021150000.1 uncharacterized protein LOC110362496 isoform X9 [Columba livia]XP_021150001.1 uncharacterized protein LOC110362496 isoform X9 [Columba livia]XP_021150002.1 uncharacterized protein LO
MESHAELLEGIRSQYPPSHSLWSGTFFSAPSGHVLLHNEKQKNMEVLQFEPSCAGALWQKRRSPEGATRGQNPPQKTTAFKTPSGTTRKHHNKRLERQEGARQLQKASLRIKRAASQGNRVWSCLLATLPCTLDRQVAQPALSLVGKKRAGKAWQLEGMAWEHEQGGRRDCYLAGIMRG